MIKKYLIINGVNILVTLKMLIVCWSFGDGISGIIASIWSHCRLASKIVSLCSKNDPHFKDPSDLGYR
jgi:hypothetical protein